MYGTAIGTAIAADGDTQYIDSMASAMCADKRPTWECFDADIGYRVCDHTQHKQVTMESPKAPKLLSFRLFSGT